MNPFRPFQTGVDGATFALDRHAPPTLGWKSHRERFAADND